MRYLSGEEVLFIHSEIIDCIGGVHGMRDVNLFLSILERPKVSFGGREMYRETFEKAAVYCEGFARYHVFVDGNKRTAMTTAARFLDKNGYILTAKNNELEQFALRVATEKISLENIVRWFKMHSRKVKTKS